MLGIDKKNNILKFTFLLIGFEDLNSLILLTCFLYEKHICLILYRYFQKYPLIAVLGKKGSKNLDKIPGK